MTQPTGNPPILHSPGRQIGDYVVQAHLTGDPAQLHFDMRYEKVVICGAARTGTTLLQYMMRMFDRALVVPGEIPAPFVRPLVPFSSFFVVTKAPGDVENVQVILTLDPKTLVIVMRRDPRDTMCSKVAGQYGYRIYKPDYVGRIARAIIAAETVVAQYPLNVRILRYEDLVAHPDRVQENLAELLDEQVTRKFSDFYLFPDYPQLNDEFSPPRPVSTNSVGQWRKKRHHRWLREVLEAQGDALCRMVIDEGYEKDREWVKEIG